MRTTVCRSVRPAVVDPQSACLFIRASFHQAVVRPPVNPFVLLSVRPSVRSSVYLSFILLFLQYVRLSIRQSVHLFVRPYVLPFTVCPSANSVRTYVHSWSAGHPTIRWKVRLLGRPSWSPVCSPGNLPKFGCPFAPSRHPVISQSFARIFARKYLGITEEKYISWYIIILSRSLDVQILYQDSIECLIYGFKIYHAISCYYHCIWFSMIPFTICLFILLCTLP